MDKVKQQQKALVDNTQEEGQILCCWFYPNTNCIQANWADVHEHLGRREVNHTFR